MRAQQFSLELNHQTNHTYDLITIVKTCAESVTLLGRTDNRELVNVVLRSLQERESVRSAILPIAEGR